MSQNETDSKPRDFLPVEDIKEGELLLREAAKTLASVFFWTKDQSLSFSTQIVHHSSLDRFFLANLPGNVDAKLLEETMKRLGPTECYFSVSLTRANVFFQATFMGIESTGVKFSAPKRIFKVQRRQNLRFQIPDGHVLKVTIQDPIFPEKSTQRKVVDLSTGGMSVIFSEEERILVHPELQFKKIAFSIRGRLIECQAEVRHIRSVLEHPRHKGVFVGLQFHDLTKPDQAWISAYVFEESRKFYSKFL